LFTVDDEAHEHLEIGTIRDIQSPITGM
jgi:hypothetical protein